jgi:Zn-dependent protease with chaperone function
MSIGRILIAVGAIVLILGLLLSLGERLPIRIGRLPGDIVIRGKNSVFYFPLVTCLLLSVVLSFVMWLIGRR